MFGVRSKDQIIGEIPYLWSDLPQLFICFAIIYMKIRDINFTGSSTEIYNLHIHIGQFEMDECVVEKMGHIVFMTVEEGRLIALCELLLRIVAHFNACIPFNRENRKFKRLVRRKWNKK